jgi:hypothetical protein
MKSTVGKFENSERSDSSRGTNYPTETPPTRRTAAMPFEEFEQRLADLIATYQLRPTVQSSVFEPGFSAMAPAELLVDNGGAVCTAGQRKHLKRPSKTATESAPGLDSERAGQHSPRASKQPPL